MAKTTTIASGDETARSVAHSAFSVGSLFSGVGGFDMGFLRAGFDVRWQCEIDPSCQDVLRRQFPETDVIYSNIETMPTHQVERVDVLIGGFPCQDLSVAGRRAGLDGSRSGLFFEFCRVIGELRPTFVVVENVPGLLSSNGGRDMGIVLETLLDLGARDIAWCVLDAQWFGVPQRRRRVFIVCDFAGERASTILALPEGLQGHPPPRREAGENVAASLTSGSHPNSNDMKHGVSEDGTGRGVPLVAHSLTVVEPDASEDGTGRGTPLTVFGVADDTAYSLRANPSHSGDKGDGGINTTMVATAFTERTRKDGRNLETSEDVAYALTNPGAGGRTQERRVMNAMGVRRLTPTECERLMGWPDGHTSVGASGKEMSDSTRYRMAGNGVATPVAEWIAHRIRQVLHDD
jgi:DNA (cytosine-5)-methyltransferase 1